MIRGCCEARDFNVLVLKSDCRRRVGRSLSSWPNPLLAASCTHHTPESTPEFIREHMPRHVAPSGLCPHSTRLGPPGRQPRPRALTGLPPPVPVGGPPHPPVETSPRLAFPTHPLPGVVHIWCLWVLRLKRNWAGKRVSVVRAYPQAVGGAWRRPQAPSADLSEGGLGAPVPSSPQ